MYVFSRKKNEQLVIGDDVFITVVEIRGDKVRLGIENPREMPVHRKEVYEAIQRSMPGSAPATHSAAAPPQVDRVAQLAAALQARLGVAVSRDTVARSLREAGIDA